LLVTLGRGLKISAPFQVVRFKSQEGQIVNTRVAKIVKKRDRLLKKYKKLRDIDHLKKAQSLSKQIRKIIREEEKIKLQTKLEKSNPKFFWTTIKLLVGQHEIDSVILRNRKKMIKDKQMVANMFVDFFVKKFEDLRQKNYSQDLQSFRN